ncbi:hypothetical protein [Marinibacterium sp. SX1]|uniref:hypothetical protein n=1 Tax=Marinibacterium sp. SX1 TaxID=3388424 RepID=UPI003D176485
MSLKSALCLAAACATCAATPILAQQEVMRGPGGSDIYQVDANVIEVVSNLGQDRGFWCGAVKYLRHHHTDWHTAIYVVSGPAETDHVASGQGVKFAIDPAAAGVTPAAESAELAPGNWQTMTVANRGCNAIDNPQGNG